MLIILKNSLYPFIPILTRILYLIKAINGRCKGNGEFRKRIRHRHQMFWQVPNAEKVRNTIMDATDSVGKWQDVENWQRKLSNKYNAREFAKKHGCRLPELYWKGRDLSSFDLGKLPSHYVIRPTIGHSCNLVFLMNNGVNLLDKLPYANDRIMTKLTAALDKTEYLEFLIEEFVRTEQGEYKIPIDYKFYMFNGELATIQVINRTAAKKAFTSWYDQDWKRMQNVNTNYAQGPDQQRPACLQEMLSFARKLSKGYQIFVRVDFYATDKGAVFGEFTPTPAVGDYFTPYGDKLFVEYWDKYCKDLI